MVKKLNAIEGYQKDFQKVFGTEVTADGIAKAIASFERTVISGNAPYDRFRAGDEKSLSESAKRGLELFEGKANCVTCHVGFNFTDEGYRNIGVGMNKENPDLGRFELTSKFYSQADFMSAEFDSLAMLLSPRFGSPIDFRPDKFHAAEFHSLTMFAFAGFDSLANFAFAEFDSLVIFGGAQFDGLANFEGAHFKSYVDFFGAQFDGLANFHGARFRNKVNL